MKSSVNIVDHVINQDLCVGCGACLYNTPVESVKMDWNKEGFLVPTAVNSQQLSVVAYIDVCPFNPEPDPVVRTEDELADIFFQDTPNRHAKIGKFYSTYVGFSVKHRLTSSSGGIATYIVTELLEQKIADAVIAVGEGEGKHYEYRLITSKEDLTATAKTKYYPVSMADALREVKNFEGKVAVVGIGCFIKSVRLLQHYHPELNQKIVFTVGIICGGLKSKFFGDFLAAKTGIKNNEYTKPQFRIKDLTSYAADYSFGCTDNSGQKRFLKMRSVGDMWGTGMFKCNACDFCDDVTTELADISLGDAWISPYNNDGKGTNVVVTRSVLAEELIIKGRQSEKLEISDLPIESLLASQQGSFNHRHKALNYRIHLSKKQGTNLPPKRHTTTRLSLYLKWVQRQRSEVRKRSLLLWSTSPDFNEFDNNMRKLLQKLHKVTVLYHYKRALVDKIGLK